MMTFTSDKERREVAARMREIMRKNPHMWLDVMVANAVCDVMGEGVVIGETVADLIDRPTCRNLSGCEDMFECSECRCKVELITEVCNEHGEPFHVPLVPSYCPNCGAKVVR